MNDGRVVTTLVSMIGTSVQQFEGMQSDTALIGACDHGCVIFCGEASPLKPSVDRDHIEIGIGGERILIDRASRRPPVENIDDRDFLHDRIIMTDLVISQGGQYGN